MSSSCSSDIPTVASLGGYNCEEITFLNLQVYTPYNKEETQMRNIFDCLETGDTLNAKALFVLFLTDEEVSKTSLREIITRINSYLFSFEIEKTGTYDLISVRLFQMIEILREENRVPREDTNKMSESERFWLLIETYHLLWMYIISFNIKRKGRFDRDAEPEYNHYLLKLLQFENF